MKVEEMSPSQVEEACLREGISLRYMDMVEGRETGKFRGKKVFGNTDILRIKLADKRATKESLNG